MEMYLAGNRHIFHNQVHRSGFVEVFMRYYEIENETESDRFPFEVLFPKGRYEMCLDKALRKSNVCSFQRAEESR